MALGSHWTIGEDLGDPTALDWANAARQHLSDARALLSAQSYQSAYMSAGMAIEMALKARIMHVERLNQWPSRKRRPELYSHRLGALVEFADIRPALEREYAMFTDLGLSWMVIKDFDINARYPTSKPFPKHLAEDYVEAVGILGLLEWLTNGIS